MPTFPSIEPIIGAQKQSEPIVRKVQFGDGYEQRLRFGLHQNPKKWSLTFMVDGTDASTIETFLDTQASTADSFDWTPPDAVSGGDKWVCDQWSKSLVGDDFYQIEATFRQVFEP